MNNEDTIMFVNFTTAIFSSTAVTLALFYLMNALKERGHESIATPTDVGSSYVVCACGSGLRRRCVTMQSCSRCTDCDAVFVKSQGVSACTKQTRLAASSRTLKPSATPMCSR